MSLGTAVAEGRMPGRVWLYSNYHCNIACRYCLTESGPAVARRELSPAAMLETAQEARELGFTDLGVTGGETFLMPSMPELLGELSAILPVIVLTNATLFGRRLLDRIRAVAGLPVALQVSLDRPDPDPNDVMRAPGNFAKVVAAIPALVERGVTVRIATTVESIADAELDRLCALHRRLGVPDSEHVIRPIVRRGRAVTHALGVQAVQPDLPAELTVTADGAFWSPFGPTVHDGVLDTDLLLTRTTRPAIGAREHHAGAHGGPPARRGLHAQHPLSVILRARSGYPHPLFAGPVAAPPGARQVAPPDALGVVAEEVPQLEDLHEHRHPPRPVLDEPSRRGGHRPRQQREPSAGAELPAELEVLHQRQVGVAAHGVADVAADEDGLVAEDPPQSPGPLVGCPGQPVQPRGAAVEAQA